MKKKIALITGAMGLVGSESVRFFADRGFKIIGIDNDMRKYFFGKEASTNWNKKLIIMAYGKNYIHCNADIRDEKRIKEIFKDYGPFEIIIHTAAQPSHDWAAKEPITDFSINALGTLVLLENYRHFSPEAVFIFTSTNKVYGDNPNYLPLMEGKTRFEISKKHKYHKEGIDETMPIDQNKHSLFGVSKASADLMVQEYGKYFNLPTGVFRGGCITGPAHSGAHLHGFLAYLIKCIANDKKYTILGYKGKQVRDNIHAFDLVNMFWNFYQNPRAGEVYNAGGSRFSNISVLEAIDKIERITSKKAVCEYADQNRIGDHIWYISDVSKFKSHFPKWKLTKNIDHILEEMCKSA